MQRLDKLLGRDNDTLEKEIDKQGDHMLALDRIVQDLEKYDPLTAALHLQQRQLEGEALSVLSDGDHNFRSNNYNVVITKKNNRVVKIEFQV